MTFPVAVRYRPPINTTFYFDEAYGSNSNDGLTPATAWKDLHYGIGVYHDDLDLIAGAPQIVFQLADNCDAAGNLLPGLVGYAGIHYAGPATGAEGRSTLVIQGNASNPLQTKVLGNNSGLWGFQTFGNSRLRIKDLFLCGGSGPCLTVEDHSQARLSNVVFGGSVDNAIFAQINSSIILETGISFKGSSTGANSALVRVQHGSRFISQGKPITLLANVSVAVAAFHVSCQSAADLYGTSFASGFTMTGKKYKLEKQSYLDTGTGKPDLNVFGTISGVKDATCYAN